MMDSTQIQPVVVIGSPVITGPRSPVTAATVTNHAPGGPRNRRAYFTLFHHVRPEQIDLLLGDAEYRGEEDDSDPTGESIVKGDELGQNRVGHNTQSVHDDADHYGTGGAGDEGDEEVSDPATPAPGLSFARFFSNGYQGCPHGIWEVAEQEITHKAGNGTRSQRATEDITDEISNR